MKKGIVLSFYKFILQLHFNSAFFFFPFFVFFNAGVKIGNLDLSATLANPVTIGIILGLVLGKPIGIFVFTYIATKLKMSELPEGTNWSQIIGVGFIAGIGFTMSLFISSLAFENSETQTNYKLGILIASVLTMIAGYLIIRFSSRGKKQI